MCIITSADLKGMAQKTQAQENQNASPQVKGQAEKVKAATQVIPQTTTATDNVDPRAKMTPRLFTHV